MNVLQLITRACKRMGQPVPAAVLGANDATCLQMGALLEEVGKDLAEKEWTGLKQTVTFASSGNELIGSVATVLGQDFAAIVPATFWNRTLRRPIFGPLGDPAWQYYQSIIVNGPTYQWRIENGQLYITPTLPLGHTLSVVKRRKWWVNNNLGVPIGDYFTADDNQPFFEDELMMLGFKWRWKYEKGVPYQEDMNTFEMMVAERCAKQSEISTKYMDGPRDAISPGIWVPAGNLPL